MPQRRVYALNSTKRKFDGDRLPLRLPDWSYQTGGPIYSSVAVTDAMVFVGSDDDRIYAFGL